MVWPDIVILAILAFALLKGFKRGFILELSGAAALAVSLAVPWFYNGSFDAPVENALHVGAGAAHVIAMGCLAVAAYLAVFLFARILNAFAKLPVLGTGNAVAGALVSGAKAVVFLWVVLYVALFFPLSADLRRDLHRSFTVNILTSQNAAIDRAVIATLPWFARPYAEPLFARHRV
jgi:uncharacterized membrane protein required for colicin V production